MNYYNVNNFLKDEQLVYVTFPEKIYQTKLYKNVNPFIKIELPIFSIKFLLENDFCSVYNNKNSKEINNNLLIYLKDDLYAQPEIVNLKNIPFYSFINIHNNNLDDEQNIIKYDEFFINTIFLKRMGFFSKILVKNDFSKNDLIYLSSEEKKIIINARNLYQKFENYEINLI